MPYQHRKSSVASATKQSSRKSSGWPLLARLPSPQLWLLALLLLITAPSVPLNLIISPAVAAGSTTSPWPAHVTGYVYARNLVRDNNGNPIFATFDETGAVIEELPEYNDAEGDHILSADRYRSHQKRYQDYRNSRPKSELKGSKVRSKSAYESTQFTTLRDEVVSPKPILMASTRSVLTRAKTQTFTPQTSPILFQSPIDLNNPDLNGSSQSVILDKNGVFRYESEYRIGYRSAYVKPRGGDTEQCRPAYNSDEDQRSFIRASEDEPCGPISGALVTTIVYSGIEGGVSSDQKGQYSLLYIKPPCPGFDFEYTSFIIPKLFYRSYNPRSLGLGLYYTVSTVYDYCMGAHERLKYSGTLSGLSAYMSIVASIAAAPTYIKRLNLSVDVTVLNGVGHVGNSLRKEDAIPLEEKTEYQTDLPQHIAIPPEALDLDGDRIPDPVEQEQKDYDGDGILDGYGVYLNGKQPGDLDAEGNPILPDLIKRPDYALDTQDQGLLKTLSREDLIDTDLYVYRSTTNQLLFERKSLDIKKSLEIEEGDFVRGQDTGIIDDGTTGFFYLSLLPSRRASYSYLRTDFETWQSKAKINPALHQREADHLRPGEPIKIIAINRATGYIGTVTTLVKNGANNNSSLIDFAINDIVMRPPNLKVEAKRVYKIESGLTRGEERNYLIGFEGAGLTSDQQITLTTTWLDHDGTALPSDLPGYTGRLAVITRDRTISGSLAEFRITPGRNLELIQLPSGKGTQNHYYLHINGKPPEDDPDFSSLGAGEGLLEQRPEHYVPFKVAIYDEIETRKRRNQQRYAYEDELIDTLSPIEGVYAWPYRPEMRFTTLELDIKNLNRTDADNNIIDILPPGIDDNAATIPGLASGDQMLQILYSLETNTDAPLDPFGPAPITDDPNNSSGQEYVFLLGEDEVNATLGENQTLTFENPEHILALDSNDYFTMSLIQNSDAENILWEYAFEYLHLLPWSKGPTHYISADDADVYLNVIIPGYLSRDTEYQEEYQLHWIVGGDGSIYPPKETNNLGNFSSKLTLPRITGSTAKVVARLGVSPESKAISANFEIVPGAPRLISVSTSGTAAIAGVGAINLEVTIKDQWSNLVADGTAVSVEMVGDAGMQADIETTAGKINIVVTGSETPGSKQLIIRADKAETTQTINIEDIVLAVTLPEAFNAQSVTPVTITGSTSAGSLDGIQLLVGSSKGILQEGLLTFNGNSATTALYSGVIPGDGIITGRVAGTTIEQGYIVKPLAGGEIDTIVLVGDQANDGSVSVTTPQGTFEAPYKTSTTYTVQGTPGEMIPISLGGAGIAVKEPVLDFPMKSLHNNRVLDRYGIVTGFPTDIIAVADSPETITGSYQFGLTSAIRVPQHSAYDLVDNIGFSLNFKANQYGGTLFSHDRKPQKLTLQSNGTLQYQITTNNGTFQVNSATISLDDWHRVSAHYTAGEISLTVNGIETTTPASGEIISATSTSGLKIGSGFQGNINEFKLYDLNAPNLLVFPNGTTETTVTIQANGHGQTQIISTGKLGQRTLTADASGFDKAFGFFINSAHATAAPIRVPVQYSVNSPAGKTFGWIVDAATYASEVTAGFAKGFITGAGDNATTAETIGDIISGFFIYGDIRDSVWHSYLQLKDHPDYDKVTHTLAILALMIRAAGPVGIAAGTALSAAKGLAKNYNRTSPFMKVLGNHLEFVVNRLKKGSLSEIQRMEPFLLLFAWISVDADLRHFLQEAIPTEEALQDWIEYVAQGAGLPRTVASVDQSTILDFFLSSAHATVVSGTVKAMVELMEKVIDDSPRYNGSLNRNTQLGQVARLFRGAIKELNKLDPSLPMSAYSHDTTGLKAFLAVNKIGGEAGLKALLNHTGWINRSVDDVVKDLATLDLNAANGKMTQEAVEGMKHVIKDFQVYFNKSHGAVHQVHAIVSAQKTGLISSVEKTQILTNIHGKVLGKRVYDFVVETANGTLYVEAKAWSPQYYKKYLRASMNSTEAALKKGKYSGQLFKDIVEFKRQGFKGVQWQFDSRLAGKESEIADEIMDLVDKKRKYFMAHLGIDDPDEWLVFTGKMADNISTFVKVLD